jgi:hypothetical protein
VPDVLGLLDPENGGTTVLQNTGDCLGHNAVRGSYCLCLDGTPKTVICMEETEYYWYTGEG